MKKCKFKEILILLVLIFSCFISTFVCAGTDDLCKARFKKFVVKMREPDESEMKLLMYFEQSDHTVVLKALRNDGGIRPKMDLGLSLYILRMVSQSDVIAVKYYKNYSKMNIGIFLSFFDYERSKVLTDYYKDIPIWELRKIDELFNVEEFVTAPVYREIRDWIDISSDVIIDKSISNEKNGKIFVQYIQNVDYENVLKSFKEKGGITPNLEYSINSATESKASLTELLNKNYDRLDMETFLALKGDEKYLLLRDHYEDIPIWELRKIDSLFRLEEYVTPSIYVDIRKMIDTPIDYIERDGVEAITTLGTTMELS